MTKFTKARQLLWRVEDTTLALMLFAMILVAVIQIILRNVFGTGLLWADAFVRVLVLWTALIGAMVAARSARHIGMDILTTYLPNNLQTAVHRINYAAVCIITVLASFFATKFVISEYETELRAFLDVPMWMTQTVIPLAFAVIALRYAANAFAANAVKDT